MFLRFWGSLKSAQDNWIRKSANRKKYIVRKSQIRKVLHQGKVCKSLKIIFSPQITDLRFAELFCGPPTPLHYHYDRR
jgi:hypothetical protein